MESERTKEKVWSRNAEEELRRLREAVAKKEEELRGKNESYDRDALIKEELQTYAKMPPSAREPKPEALPEKELEKIVLNLSPEAHDDAMGELIGILQERGLLSALSVVERMRNPHIEDDFHRFVV